MVYDITLICQQTVCFFMTDLASWFRSKLQSVAVMRQVESVCWKMRLNKVCLRNLWCLIRVVLVTMMTQVGPMI